MKTLKKKTQTVKNKKNIAQELSLKKENSLLKQKIKNLKSTMERTHQLPVEIDRLRQSLAAFFVAEQIRSTAMEEIFKWHQNNKQRP